jgi:hypothetical protein
VQFNDEWVIDLYEDIPLSLRVSHHALFYDLFFVQFLHSELFVTVNVLNEVHLPVGPLTQQSHGEEVIDGWFLIMRRLLALFEQHLGISLGGVLLLQLLSEQASLLEFLPVGFSLIDDRPFN